MKTALPIDDIDELDTQNREEKTVLFELAFSFSHFESALPSSQLDLILAPEITANQFYT